jgi:hypothetical protein
MRLLQDKILTRAHEILALPTADIFQATATSGATVRRRFSCGRAMDSACWCADHPPELLKSRVRRLVTRHLAGLWRSKGPQPVARVGRKRTSRPTGSGRLVWSVRRSQVPGWLLRAGQAHGVRKSARYARSNRESCSASRTNCLKIASNSISDCRTCSRSLTMLLPRWVMLQRTW